MPKTTIYLNKEEHAWFKKQPEGHLRKLIQLDMVAEEVERVVAQKIQKKEKVVSPEEKKLKKIVKGEYTVKVETPSLKKGDGKTTCKDCGYLLPYYKGKCKNC